MKYLYIICIFLLISCSTKRTVYVPVESIRTEYINVRDSIYLQDSIFLEIKTLHDTVFYTKYKYKLLERFKTDTIIKIDSIPVIKEVEKIVEVNHIYWWLKSLMWLGGILLGLSLFKFYRKWS